MSIEALARRELERLESQGLLRTPRTIEGHQGPEVVVDGAAALCFCSNNYLGLADHPAICEAAIAAIEAYGFGTCGARHVTGSMRMHTLAEERIAAFFGQQSALFFPTGYAANLAAIQALAGPGSLVLSDELNHASLIDGCRLSRAHVKVFRHVDVEHVAALLTQHRADYESVLVVTESLFSMDGDFAPLRQLRALCDRHDAGLIVDDAHALGALGEGGRGACAWMDVKPDLLTGTFGKAFGSSGAFVAGATTLVRWIENRARTHIFSTAPSAALPAAVLAAIDLVEGADDRRIRLREHALLLRRSLSEAGYQVGAGESHIIPLVLGTPERAMTLSRRLLERGVFVHGIRPPSVAPGTSRLRITPMATHTCDQVLYLAQVLRELRGAG